MGEQLELTVGPVAHGGHCVARTDDGQVVFVRHTLPGEQIVAEVTETGRSFLRADCVQVLRASADRVPAPCPYAGPGRCGGCDFQHVSPGGQRRLLGSVVAEQLQRLAGLDVEVEVEPVPGDRDGLGWRTRVRYVADAEGRLGLRRHRSHTVVPVDRCLIAADGFADAPTHTWPGTASVEAVWSGSHERLVVVEPKGPLPPRLPRIGLDGAVTSAGERLRGRTYATERAVGRDWRVAAAGFWQVHPGAADTMVAAVLQYLRPQPGERAVDLYSGVGLFSAALAEAVGPGGSVLAVEGTARAAKDARRNLHDLPQVRIETESVERSLRREDGAADVVVLDPPRTGARAEVVSAVVALRPRAVAYVACDPAALARDVATFATQGYELTGLRAFALFPMTHHVECVALLEPRARHPVDAVQGGPR
ncbi:MAG TPA: TRAM domain-containing protein [Nocardioidaceae bacterium]|nr:TRAM domain-containing protein [Nocardioidaceae bacterium]